MKTLQRLTVHCVGQKAEAGRLREFKVRQLSLKDAEAATRTSWVGVGLELLIFKC